MSDLVSRQAVIDAIFSEPLYESGMKKRDADVVVPAIYEKIKSLPSVKPKRETTTLKIGRSMRGVTMWYECDACGEPVDKEDAFCRRCGRGIIHE